ncbi:hypothetical protein JOQ06_026716 [Pogonophryne albipinna]|uniref:Uncharacterized protein n=1 Tax=Pogonophryne albipinna TaxID=1090488 RepID=A0AAD6BBF2_9TELE|nr:hypothetical protein JOQ06_026716 [Pogonophryne albipinna]
MSAANLAPLTTKYDLKLVCTKCSVEEKEITYRLKPVQHQCACNLLLCRAKCGSKWRPVSKRPTFPNPVRYEVCYFFKEGQGCSYHKNRCTFARSDEEADVWTFEKCHRINHVSLCNLVAQSEGGADPPDHSESLRDLPALDLKAVCDLCSVKENQISYTVQSVSHKCSRNLLLAKDKACDLWRPVSERPTCGRNVFYQVCQFFVEGSGCTKHGQMCTYARSDEEATLWNYVKDKHIGREEFIRLVVESEPISITPESTAESILQQFPGEFIELCKRCFNDKPQQLTTKRWNPSCSADAAHPWDPVLVHHLSENKRKHVYSKVRPLPQNCHFEFCSHVTEGKPCWHQAGRCQAAHSEVEMAVWRVEHGGVSVRPYVLQLSRQQQAEQRLKEQQLTEQQLTEQLTEQQLTEQLTEQQLTEQLTEQQLTEQLTEQQLTEQLTEQQLTEQLTEQQLTEQLTEQQLTEQLTEQQLTEQLTEQQPVSMYCRVCLLVLSSPESFFEHCSSLEHAQLLSEDTTTRWRGRQPPHNHRAEFWLCERPQTCEYGSKCPKAHSGEELKEWLMRAAEEKEIRQSIGAQGLMNYNLELLEEYKNSSNEVHILSEQVNDVSISCDGDVTVECEQINETLRWNFQVETERQLVHVALLKQEPGASYTLGDISSVPCIYSPGEPFLTDDMTYDITVSFTSINPGLYDQWLVLDFDMRPVLLKKLRVRVGKLSLDDVEQPTVTFGYTFQSAERWHRGNRVIIPCSSRTEEQEKLLKKYKPPQISFLYKSSYSSQTPLNSDNYRERMHQFLYDEEQAEDQIVSRLNVCGGITTSEMLNSTKFGMMMAPRGELFCAVSTPCKLTPDTPEGLALKRSIQSALIAPLSESSQNSKVYEASILKDKTSENTMYLQLSNKCCSDLTLRSNESYQMEVQFQLNRHSFCTMHKAVDLLPDTKRVLPDLKHCGVPVNNIKHEKLNPKQQSAVDFITGSSNVQKYSAPLLIYGPFGTGKTFTLALAARELCKLPPNKVLICTHTNSSADLYVRDHFHPFINKKDNGTRPIRIKVNKQGKALFATDEITLKYCLLSEDKQSFLPPTKAALDRHKIVITTTTMARHFHDLNLPEGYFTHILIDEASQMLECEALMALGLAGPQTRVVLAGDHMQMGPKLFSVDDHHRSNHTLLNRLFHYYQGQKCEAAQNSRIIFSENYRSTKEIVEFVSTNFYVGKNDVIKAKGNVPPPANGNALKFHHVRGECLLDTGSMSWCNKEEVVKVAEAVKEVLEQWPLTWGPKDPSSICILSDGCQVWQMRKALSKRGLNEVHVENLANVQGKQFRAVIMTAVQTRDSLKTSHLPGLELFNDARVLNTAMTRAQSQVVVVGDAAALCCFGNCSKVWKSYIDHCISNNSVTPKHFTKDFFMKDVMETARFQKPEHVDESSTLSDAILQELKDDYELLKKEHHLDEDKWKCKDFNNHRSRLSYNISDVDADLLKYPGMYKHGKLVRESYNKGYVVPFDNPTSRIRIKGRDNMGKTFTGDEVVLQTAKVISITKQSESARVLVCLLEDEDHSKPRQNSEETFIKRTMIPIAKSAPKIRILISKRKRNCIPIWEKMNGQWTTAAFEHLDEKLKQNNVFVVQIIGWKENCYNPLGNVIDILPIGSSLVGGLRILNEEFKVEPNTCNPDEGLFSQDEDGTHREDLSHMITFTVDPKEAKDLDDAISVREIGEHEYELGVHIADVASFVIPGCELDKEAEQRGTTYYSGSVDPVHMFPKELSTGTFSLLSDGKQRRVVSLMFKVNKKTNEIIGKHKLQLSGIKSNRQLSYDEAEAIITDRYREGPAFDSVEDCVTVAYGFAKARRKDRLGSDWVYSQPDDKRLPGKRKANMMVEELSVLFNTLASKDLIDSKKTLDCTPLRCQSKPDCEKIEDFKAKCGELIPLSFHVRHKVEGIDEVGEQPSNCENIRILTEVWEDIQSAARADDIDKMVDLIAADDIHPPLQPVVDQFRKCSSKAKVICSSSHSREVFRHYSLNVDSYTQATSPIRRYMDLISQRLLHSIIHDRRAQYTTPEIATLCSQFEDNVKNAKEYEQKAEQISYARGDTLQIQMTTEIRRGYILPAVQLVRIKPRFEICVDHVHSAITCFAKYAEEPSKILYRDTNEYVQIWTPLCKMESASTAVDESDSIVIENLVKNTSFTVEIIPKSLPDIRKEEAVENIPYACDLVKAIALGKHIPKEVKPMWNHQRKELPYGLPQFNQSQHLAVEKALNNTFTIIQGPPGTGKTVVGVKIVFGFFELNAKSPRTNVDPRDEKKKQVILYCGPSNKSVDVVAEYLLRFGDRLRPLRFYSQQVEMLDYPYPDCALQFSRRSIRQERAKPELRSITLHHRMREDTNPSSGQIKDFDLRIKLVLEKGKKLPPKEVKEYKKLLVKARKYEFERHDIILCTCTQSSTPNLTKTVSARQILIDECAMATEPQVLIPLVCNRPEKIVLIGDHKQLRPIVKNVHVRRMGMAKSLFERYHTMHKKSAVMLDTQYRMHEEICKFPSQEFYEGNLLTGVEQSSSVLRVDNKTMPIVFGDIRGKTVSLVVNTAKGNENSKANEEERIKVIDIAEKLVTKANIEQQNIVILSPYNAQVSEIRDGLKKKKLDGITATTITKSQGSEWSYVIISTVCSLPSEQIEVEQDGGWLSRHLGFVADPNQINVGITRAKEGLCIIGNQELLNCGRTWKKLLDHFKLHNAVTDADKISVLAST